MWLRTGVMPRWLAFVTYAVALVLLFVTTLSLWVTLDLPGVGARGQHPDSVANYRRGAAKATMAS